MVKKGRIATRTPTSFKMRWTLARLNSKTETVTSLSPGRGNLTNKWAHKPKHLNGPEATLLILTLLFFCKLCNYMEFSKPGFASSPSRKDERIAKSAFPQGRRVSLMAFFSHYMLGAEEEICEYLLFIVARVAYTL